MKVLEKKKVRFTEKTYLFSLKMNLEIHLDKKKGRSVIAGKSFKKGDQIDICTTIPLDAKETKKVMKTVLSDYVFGDPDDPDCSFVVLSQGSVFNHSKSPNAENYFEKMKGDYFMVIRATKPIARGEEITISYLGDNKDNREVWFDIED